MAHVVARLARRRSMPFVLLASAGLVSAALAVGLVEASGLSPASGALAVKQGATTPPGTYVAAARLISRVRREQLPVAPSAPLVGAEGPVAVPSPDRRWLLYNTWAWVKPIDWHLSLAQQGIQAGDVLGTPSIRLHDTRKGADRLLEQGALSPAWRSDGALAYARGVRPGYREGVPFLTEIDVRSSPAARPGVWSISPDRYLVYGWAGRRLVVVRSQADGRHDVLVFDGPRAAHVLAGDAGVLAISPDGSAVLVLEGGTAEPVLRLVLAADGRELASLRVASMRDPVTRQPLRWVGGPGSWAGERLVLTASDGLVVLRVSGRELAAEQVLHADLGALTAGSFNEPRFAAGGQTIVTWADVASAGRQSRSVQFVCDRISRSCTREAPVASIEAPRPIYDLSGGR